MPFKHVFGQSFKERDGNPGETPVTQSDPLGNYSKAEMEPLSDVLAAIAAEAEWLADGDDARFMSEVALRLQQSD